MVCSYWIARLAHYLRNLIYPEILKLFPMPKKVLESLHNRAADHCIDIFVRDDGTFGYEEYRRDYEDGSGWFSLKRYGHQDFETKDQALTKAQTTVQWLRTAT